VSSQHFVPGHAVEHLHTGSSPIYQIDVRVRSTSSQSTRMLCGIPQGLVLGAILFLIYGGDLQRLIEEHGLRPHLYADDSQIYGSCRPEMQTRISACIDDVAEWMRSNRLQLNSAKTEILWCASSRRLHQLPTTALRVDLDHLAPSVVVRDLGILLDADVSTKSHVTQTVSINWLLRAAAAAFHPSFCMCRDLYYSHWWCHVVQ